ncbi:MAG: glucose-6-phosphate isomerase family protein [Candidatus Paceibacterales bacterium]
MEIEPIDLTNLTPDKRYLTEMENVVYDKEWFKTAENFELYDMYRKMKIENGLRYDVTIIHPHMFGNEFAKTKGHIHAGFYGEVYMVLDGEGFYFAQKGDENNIEDVFVVHAKKGDVILIPAGYGHVTINPSTQDLKTANWVAESDKGNFEPFERNQGACYYYITPGTWVKNDHYKNVPPLRFQEPLKEVPKDLEFLKVK